MEEAELEAQKHQNCIKLIENASSNPFHRTALENFRKERKKKRITKQVDEINEIFAVLFFFFLILSYLVGFTKHNSNFGRFNSGR